MLSNIEMLRRVVDECNELSEAAAYAERLCELGTSCQDDSANIRLQLVAVRRVLKLLIDGCPDIICTTELRDGTINSVTGDEKTYVFAVYSVRKKIGR